jgi:hypothetical protein
MQRCQSFPVLPFGFSHYSITEGPKPLHHGRNVVIVSFASLSALRSKTFPFYHFHFDQTTMHRWQELPGFVSPLLRAPTKYSLFAVIQTSSSFRSSVISETTPSPSFLAQKVGTALPKRLGLLLPLEPFLDFSDPSQCPPSLP